MHVFNVPSTHAQLAAVGLDTTFMHNTPLCMPRFIFLALEQEA